MRPRMASGGRAGCEQRCGGDHECEKCKEKAPLAGAPSFNIEAAVFVVERHYRRRGVKRRTRHWREACGERVLTSPACFGADAPVWSAGAPKRRERARRGVEGS
jgi:hypothetical protein